ncbi:6-phosphogluconolactonase [Melioribacter sp. OK-6-Me]|uniref:6-phosphogluconolactonase n=1 Tax=unclassified Melioribacter TaxID=2627329 RepID=UPI003EDA77EF
MKNEKLIIFTDIDEIARLAVDYINSQTKNFQPQAYFTIALAGGNTPKRLFKKIAEDYSKNIAWERIKLFWGDERCVPPDNDESNFKMTYDNLLKYIDIPHENIFRIKGENDPAKEAANYSQLLKQNLRFNNGLPSFDLMMLGLGEDGHTASIFPDQLNLLNAEDFCAVAVHPVSGQKRITVTGKIINNASKIIILATGIKKAKVLGELLHHKPGAEKYPAYFINPTNGKLRWIVDKEAASEL